MTIARRLILMLAVVLAAMLSVAGAGFWHLYAAQQRLDHVQHSVIPGMRELAGARDNIGDIRRLVFRELLSEDSAGRSVAEHAMAAADVQIDRHLTNYANVSLADDTDRGLLKADRSAFEIYQAAQQRYLDKCRSGDQAGAKAMIFDGGALYVPSQRLAAALDAHIAYNTQSIERLGKANDAAYREAVGLLLAACAVALAIVAVTGSACIDPSHRVWVAFDRHVPRSAKRLTSLVSHTRVDATRSATSPSPSTPCSGELPR